MSKSTGIVYLIGAGPGDPELITLRGMRLLKECDAVIYDHLVPDELVTLLPRRVEKHYVGKLAGSHLIPQSEINDLMVKLARDGKNVARLKGADPLVFGRGGEEARYLREHGIEFQFVPGVTAAVGAAAYAGIPCTDRTKASFVVFATGHKAVDSSRPPVPWEQLAKLEGGTLSVYMGVGEIQGIVERLLTSGMPPDTPAAVIERGTHPTQRCFVGTVATLPDLVNDNDVEPPALFMVGEAVGLHTELDWFGKGPMHGLRILVLRPSDQASELYQSLRDHGAEVMPYPSIATEEAVDEKAWSAWRDIDRTERWLILTSENGVRYFMHQFADRIGDIRQLSAFRIAAIGFGTARALKKHHLAPDFVPNVSTVKGLTTELIEKYDWSHAAVVRVQGNLSDSTVPDALGRAGAKVVPMEVYRTYTPEWPVGFKRKLLQTPPNAILFSSGSTAEGLRALLSDEEFKKVTGQAQIVSIGPSTTRVIESYGLKVTIQARHHSVPGLVQELVEFYQSRSQ